MCENMNLNDLLRSNGIDPQQVLVLRHRPQEPQLKKVLPWLAAEKQNIFNAYQQTQNERAESAMIRVKYVALRPLLDKNLEKPLSLVCTWSKGQNQFLVSDFGRNLRPNN
jgi:hypothetical protein